MNAGFEILLSRDGQSRICLFESSRRAASQVSVADHPARPLTAVVIGRIMYRDELARQFGLELDVNDATDADVVLAAFLSGGEDALPALEGEFTAVVIDGVRDRLLVRRDPMGTFPLYRTTETDVIRVGTSLRSLAEALPSRTVNRDVLARLIAYPFAHVELPVAETAFEGTQRVLPGETLELCRGNRVRVIARWTWDAHVQPTAGLSFEEAAAHFSTMLSRAVYERTRVGGVGAHLSGGMDSSSIVCIARDLLAGEAAGRTLKAFSLAYDSPALAGERDYINAVCVQGGPLKTRFLPADEALHFDWFSGPGIPGHDESYAGLYELASQRMLADAARDEGVSTVMTGIGIELYTEGTQYRMGDLLRRGRLLAALRDAAAWARGRNASPSRMFFQEAGKRLLPRALREGFGPLFRGGYGSWPNVGLFTIPPWVRRDFARAHKLRRRGLEALAKFERFPMESSVAQFGLESSVGDWSGWYLCAAHGIRISHPFMDPRVATFVMGLPRQFKEEPGMPKKLLREAMRNRLPECIRTRRFKRGFNDVYWRGLARNLPELERLVRESPLEEMGIVDVPRFLEILRQHAVGVGDAMTGGRISTTLAMAAWFRQLSQRPELPSLLHRPQPNHQMPVAAAPGRKMGRNRAEIAATSLNNTRALQESVGRG